MRSCLRSAVALLLVMTAITGIAYPLTLTALAGVLFPAQAAGSVITVGGRASGSALIGQSFSDPKYFWGRPSATTPQAYNALASTGSNLGPLNPDLLENVRTRAAQLRAADPDNALPVPVDLVTASASGLDPEISIAAASFQAPRIARLRNLDPRIVQTLIRAHAHAKLLGVLGEPRVNVLALNLALDRLTPSVP